MGVGAQVHQTRRCEQQENAGQGELMQNTMVKLCKKESQKAAKSQKKVTFFFTEGEEQGYSKNVKPTMMMHNAIGGECKGIRLDSKGSWSKN
jgi:hypothetical protein